MITEAALEQIVDLALVAAGIELETVYMFIAEGSVCFVFPKDLDRARAATFLESMRPQMNVGTMFWHVFADQPNETVGAVFHLGGLPAVLDLFEGEEREQLKIWIEQGVTLLRG